LEKAWAAEPLFGGEWTRPPRHSARGGAAAQARCSADIERQRRTATRLLTLSRTHFVITGVTLGVLAFTCAAALLYPYGLANFTCAQFDMPQYERLFGFELGSIQLRDDQGGSYSVRAVRSVTPGGVFARSGIRPGDKPRTHHGLGDFCGDLHAALDGHEVHLRVRNLDEEGASDWRDIRLAVR
jgi:hypothetical protein